MNNYPTPNSTVDIVLFRLSNKKLNVYLVRRPNDENEPFKGMLAIPGGYVRVQVDENVEATAQRVMKEKLKIKDSVYMEQLQTFSGAKRDPRGWSMSLAYCVLMPEKDSNMVDGGEWFDVDSIDTKLLAFDHKDILAAAIVRVRSKANYSVLPAYFLDKEFTLHELKDAYEQVLMKPLDKSTFRSRILALDMLEEIQGKMKSGHQRPAQLYRIKSSISAPSFLRSNLKQSI
jgi:8-oxo-dGTP diphosphatase